MSYKIVAYDSPTSTIGHVVFDPQVNRYIIEGKLTLVENAVDNMTLTVNPNNWLYGNAKPFVTHIEVYQDGDVENRIFRGRCIQVTRQMKDNGEFLQTFVFEDILNYLKDSIQRHLKVQNMTIRQFLKKLVDVHNSQVPEYKQFTLRSVNVTNSTDNVYYYVDYVNTWETIKDKLLNRLGGVIRTDYVDGKNYIDYMTYDQGSLHQNDMQIQIGKNMQSLSVQEDPSEIVTRLVPLGATIENTDDQNTDASQPRIDITSVNNGQDYIDIPELQAEYGIINGENTWDDVHEPGILLTKAKQWIKAQAASKEAYTITALELPQYDHYVISDRYQVVNPNVVTPVYLRVIQKDIDFLDWYKSTLTIGDRTSTLSEYQRENINAKKKADELRSQTQNAVNKANKAYSSRLVGSLVSTISTQDDDDSLPLYTLKVAEDNSEFGLKAGQEFAVKTTAKGVDGLVQEIKDNSVTYQLATATSNGLMSASDKNKLDGIVEATETQAGLMSVLDKIKLNKLKEEPVEGIQIKDTVTGSIYLLTISDGEIKLEEGGTADGGE